MDPKAWNDRAPQARIWRWGLVGDRIPVERTVDVANAVIAALNQTAKVLFGTNRLSSDLHPDPAKDLSHGAEKHRHAFFLPEDADVDGYVDRIAVAMAASLGGEGFTRRGLTLLAACPGFWLDKADVRLEPMGLAAHCPLGTDAAARVWLSLTPFALALHRWSAARQIVMSLSRLGLPAPKAVDMIGMATVARGAEITADAFIPTGPALKRWEADPERPGEKLSKIELERRRGALAYWRLEFADPLPGPLVLGHLCHFGLGRFAAGED